MAASSFPFASVAEVMDTVYQEAAIILPGPPIQILAQRAAPTIVLKTMQQTHGKFYYECKTYTGMHGKINAFSDLHQEFGRY